MPSRDLEFSLGQLRLLKDESSSQGFKDMAKQLVSGGWLDILLWDEVSDAHLSAAVILPPSFPAVDEL